MNNISPKKATLIVLAVNILFLLITAINLPHDKVLEYMSGATARTMFFISLIMGIASLVYTIKGRKKGLESNFALSIINIVLSILIILLPAISFTTLQF